MTAAPPTRSIVFERFLEHPPEKVWRVLTEGPLLAAWLMPGDFRPVVGHHFSFRSKPAPNWSGLTEGEVLEVRPCERLVYSWRSSGEGVALSTTVTWTLTPTPTGALLRMEQSGFQPQHDSNFRVAARAWPRFARQLEALLAGLPDRPGALSQPSETRS